MLVLCNFRIVFFFHRNVLMKRATYREELEERVLENLPLFVLVGDQRDVHFAEVLREQEDETDGAETSREFRESPSFYISSFCGVVSSSFVH